MGTDFSFTPLSGSRLLLLSEDFNLVRAYENALNVHQRNTATPAVAHCSITARCNFTLKPSDCKGAAFDVAMADND